MALTNISIRTTQHKTIVQTPSTNDYHQENYFTASSYELRCRLLKSFQIMLPEREKEIE